MGCGVMVAPLHINTYQSYRSRTGGIAGKMEKLLTDRTNTSAHIAGLAFPFIVGVRPALERFQLRKLNRKLLCF
jgi:hypothetical protein